MIDIANDSTLAGIVEMVSRITGNKWLLAFTIFVVFYVFSAVFIFVVQRYLRSLVKKLPPTMR